MGTPDISIGTPPSRAPKTSGKGSASAAAAAGSGGC
jgi:hypothetical protein